MRRIQPILHVFLFALIPALLVFVQDPSVIGFLSPKVVIRPTVFVFCVGMLLFLAIFLLLKNMRGAGILTSAVMLAIFFDSSLLFLLGILGLLAFLQKRQKGAAVIDGPVLFLNLTSLAILLYVIVRFSFQVGGVDWQRVSAQKLDPIVDKSASTELTATARPDVYYIIVDAYGRQDVLSGIYGYDNSAFIKELEKRGFVLPEGTESNYPRTILSISSSLNMQYLDRAAQVMGDVRYWWPLQDMIEHSQLRQFFEDEGYQIVGIYSSWDFTSLADADIYFKPTRLLFNEFERYAIQSTNLRYFLWLDRLGLPLPTYRVYRDALINEFNAIDKASMIPDPKFVFAHIILPHPPFVFDSKGGPIDPSYPLFMGDASVFPGSKLQYKDGYVDQVQYTNIELLKAIDAILTNSSTAPIIIIQGDHGPGMYTDFESVANTCLYERYSILNAYHLPGLEAGSIPNNITPVNTWRLVLDHYFGTKLGMLPDKQYFSTESHLFQFSDVTDASRNFCGAIPNQ